MANWTETVYLVVVAVMVLSWRVSGYPDGAPDEACATLTPDHGPGTRQVQEPFDMFLQPIGSNYVRVTLQPVNPSVTFEGFLVRATTREVNQGFFNISSGAQVRQVGCPDGNGKMSAATHTTDEHRNSVSVDWVVTQPGCVEFQATVVLEKDEYVAGLNNRYIN